MPETTNAEDHRKTKKIKDNYLRQSLKSFNIYQVVSSLFWCSFVSYPVNASDFALGQSLMARGMDFPIYPSSRQLRTQYHPTLRNTIYYAGQFDDFTKCTVTLQTLFFSLIYVFNWEAAGVGHDTWQGRLHKSTLFQNHVDFIFILSVIVTCITIVFLYCETLCWQVHCTLWLLITTMFGQPLLENTLIYYVIFCDFDQMCIKSKTLDEVAKWSIRIPYWQDEDHPCKTSRSERFYISLAHDPPATGFLQVAPVSNDVDYDDDEDAWQGARWCPNDH